MLPVGRGAADGEWLPRPRPPRSPAPEEPRPLVVRDATRRPRRGQHRAGARTPPGRSSALAKALEGVGHDGPRLSVAGSRLSSCADRAGKQAPPTSARGGWYAGSAAPSPSVAMRLPRTCPSVGGWPSPSRSACPRSARSVSSSRGVTAASSVARKLLPSGQPRAFGGGARFSRGTGPSTCRLDGPPALGRLLRRAA